MTSDRIDELIALAALGELSALEQRELDEAVERDPVVAAELDEAITAAALLQRPHAEEPPPALRASVLAAIAATEREELVAGGATSAPAQVAAAPVAPVVSLAAERRKRMRTLLMAAAVVAVFAVGGVALVATGNDSSDPIAAVVDATDATTRSLTGEIDLTVTYSASQDALVVQAAGLPVLTDDLTYQLWLVGDDGATSVGVFRPDADGSVAERFAEVNPSGFVLGVTEEPAGGSESPTLPILATA